MKNYLTLIDIIAERSSIIGEKQAYLFLENGETETQKLTYRELEIKAKEIAVSLTSLCVPQDRVLLIYPPGLDFVEGFYGCLLAGVIAVPVYPPRKAALTSHLLAIIKDAQPKAILTHNSLCDLEPILPCIYTDQIESNQHLDWVKPEVRSEDIALLQYTSGSTGNPKGVMITHSNLLDNHRIIKRICKHTQESLILSWLPLVHDMGLNASIIQPLYLGSSAILMPPLAFLQKPIRWLEAISKYQATTSGGPNFGYDLCVSKITPQQREHLDLSKWSVASVGAEPVKAATLENFAQTFASCGFKRESLYPSYGMAEATVMICAKSQDTSIIKTKNKQKRVSCGVTEFEIAIANPETLALCKPGEEGEILVSGKSVALGYWQKPELTAATFAVKLPEKSTQPFLRTGDLGYLEEGELFITGRVKDIIIIRGRNYAAADLEEIIEQAHPSLKANCSAAFEIEVEGEAKLVVVAEVERSYRQKLAAQEVINSIRQAIASELEIAVYAIELLQPASLAKTYNGKIQRQASRQGFLSGTLKTIAQWREVAINPDIENSPLSSPPTTAEIKAWLISRLAKGIDVTTDNLEGDKAFTDYGLDSMVAITIINELGAWLGYELQPTLFAEYPSIDAVAQYLTNLEKLSEVNQLIPSSSPTETQYLPLSFAQELFWLCHQLEPRGVMSILYISRKFLGALNISALEQSINEIIRRHDILRTNIVNIDGQPMQCIASTLNIPLVRINLQEIPLEERETEAKRLAEAEINRPFNVAEEPLLRVKLLELGAENYVFLFTIHHTIIDAWSVSLFFQELAVIYEALKNGLPNPFPIPTLQYQDFIFWERQALTEDVIKSKLTAWKQEMGTDFSILRLPTDNPRSSTFSTEIAVELAIISPEITQVLRSVSKAHRVTVFVTLLAVFKLLLSRLSGQSKVLLNVPTFKRNNLQLQKLMGCLTDLLIIQTDLSGNPNFEELLQRVNQAKLKAYQYEDLPFVKMLTACQDKPEQNLLSGVWFEFISNSIEPTKQLGKEQQIFPITEKFGLKYDLFLFCFEQKETIVLKWLYNNYLFNEGTIGKINNSFHDLLKLLLKH